MIEIRNGAGFISAFYFVFLDLVLITLLDSVLSRLLSFYYYRKIYSGRPMRIQATNTILGLANSFLKPWHSLPNMIALLIKVIFVGSVFFLDLNIDAKKIMVFEKQRYFGAYSANIDVFTGEEDSLGLKPFRFIMDCKEMDGDNGTYYQVAFNFTPNVGDVDTPNVEDVDSAIDLIPIYNESTTICLSPKFVKQPKESLVVLGCSELGRVNGTPCEYEARLSKNATALSFFNLSEGTASIIEFSAKTKNYYSYSRFEFNRSVVISIFPEYVDAEVVEITCLRTLMGLPDLVFTTQCHLFVFRNGETLIELWTYNEDSRNIARKFAGPIFKGKVTFLFKQKERIIWQSFVASSSNWQSLSDIIVFEISVFDDSQQTIEILTKEVIVSQIPSFSVGIVIAMVVICISSFVITSLTVDRTDNRPHLNTINGLSSIAREERDPSGASTTKGTTMVLGLILQNDGTVRLRPLERFEDAVKQPIDENMS